MSEVCGTPTDKQPGAKVIDEFSGAMSIADIVQNYPHMRPPIIDGLLRETETMNMVAPSKVGKSWLAMDLALSVATGEDWQGYSVAQGGVLYIDNELHPQTFADRARKLATARGIDLQAVHGRFDVMCERGKIADIHTLDERLKSIQPGRYKLIILDTLYRLMPKGASENDNAHITEVYNRIDAMAYRLNCAFVCIHHASKGGQSAKAVTDVGAGAGAQSRAVDTHLILRHHEEDGVMVMDAATRSWPGSSPRAIRFTYPTWSLAADVDPRRLRGVRVKSEKPAPSPEITPEQFAHTYIVTNTPQSKIIADAKAGGMSVRTAKQTLKRAVAEKHATRANGGRGKALYSRVT